MSIDERGRARAYVEKQRAELDELVRAGVVLSGNAFSSVLLVKGVPGAAELAGEGLLAGADGPALRAALLRLGYAPEDWAALATWTASAAPGAAPAVAPAAAAPAGDARPDAGCAPLDAALLRRAVLSLDPATVVACDQAAADALVAAFVGRLFDNGAAPDKGTDGGGFAAPPLSVGVVCQICGMRMLNLGGFEAALADVRSKRVVWHYLKMLPPLGEPY